jgi:hypothetical protein
MIVIIRDRVPPKFLLQVLDEAKAYCKAVAAERQACPERRLSLSEVNNLRGNFEKLKGCEVTIEDDGSARMQLRFFSRSVRVDVDANACTPIQFTSVLLGLGCDTPMLVTTDGAIHSLFMPSQPVAASASA